MKKQNAINVIKPYRWNGMWVFDDERVGLIKEPFVAGADTMIDQAIAMKKIRNADQGFVLVFSEHPFPDADIEVNWMREEMGGDVYEWTFEEDGAPRTMEGWLCPALKLYYEEAPQKLYLQFRESQ